MERFYITRHNNCGHWFGGLEPVYSALSSFGPTLPTLRLVWWQNNHTPAGELFQSFGKGCVGTENTFLFSGWSLFIVPIPCLFACQALSGWESGVCLGGREGATLPLCCTSGHSAGQCVTGREGRVGISPLNPPHTAWGGLRNTKNQWSFTHTSGMVQFYVIYLHQRGNMANNIHIHISTLMFSCTASQSC